MTRSRLAAAAILLASALSIAAPASVGPASSASAADQPPVSPVVSAGARPVSVAVVVPLTVPPTTSGILDTDALTTYTQPGGLLDRQLDAVAGSVAAIGIDPMIIASIRVLGSAAPASALDFLTRLRAAPNEIFLLGYADADPALASVAGIGDELQPLGFDYAIDPANFGPAQTATPTPGPTDSPTPGATEAPGDPGAKPPLPTTDDLLAWPSTLPSIAWPAEGTVDKTGLAGLAALKYQDVLIGGANTSPTNSALVDLGGIDGLVIDDDIADAVREAVYAPTETQFAGAIVTLQAELRSASITSPGRTVIATLDRRWPFGTPRVAEVLGAIEAQTFAQLIPLSSVLAGPKGTATVAAPDGDADADRAATLTTMSVAASAEARYLRIADDASVLTQPRRLALLGLSAEGWRSDGPGWQAATAALTLAAQKTLAAVQVAESSDQLVLSDISSLRIRVSNALPVAVTVYVTVRPLRPLLHVDQSAVEVTIEPDSTATASIPVSSIANGDVTVRTELHSSEGLAIGDPRFLKVILQAGWETAGTLIAGTLVVLVFGGGLIRVFLRRRREKAAAAAGQATPDE